MYKITVVFKKTFFSTFMVQHSTQHHQMLTEYICMNFQQQILYLSYTHRK